MSEIGILERVDAALAKSEGLSADQVEAEAVRLLLAEQETFEAAEERAAERRRSAATPTSTSTAATDAQIYDALKKRATEEYPTLSTPAAVEKWVLANPDSYIEYRKAETDVTDPDITAEIRDRIDAPIAAGTADIRLMDMIERYRSAHPGVSKSAATVEVMKTSEALHLYKIRASGRPTLDERESRQRAITKAEADWNAVLERERAASPKATATEVLEKALQSTDGIDAAVRMRKHDGGASERAQILGQIHALTVQFMKENPQYGDDYNRAFALVTQRGLGYSLHQRYLASK